MSVAYCIFLKIYGTFVMLVIIFLLQIFICAYIKVKLKDIKNIVLRHDEMLLEGTQKKLNGST